MQTYIGTSGWAYNEWRNLFYPPGLKSGDRLAWLATQLNAVELNSSFYRLPDPKLMARWADVVPDDFRFAIKVWNEITHTRRLDDCGDAVTAFMQALAPMGDKSGPLLLQLPPSLTVDALPLLERVLAQFTSHGATQLAVEFRHRSWDIPAVAGMMDNQGTAIVLHDMKRPLSLAANNAPLVYLRYHGVKGDYKGAYGADFLQAQAAAIRSWQNERRTIYVFFNNTMTGDAPLEALGLQKMLA